MPVYPGALITRELSPDGWHHLRLERCHGVLVLPDLGKGFITDGDAGQVAVFNLKTLKITDTIKNSPDTDSIVYDPVSKLVFTFNGDSKNATVIGWPASSSLPWVVQAQPITAEREMEDLEPAQPSRGVL